MELVLEESAVTIKVVSVGGKRMSKANYSQLPRCSLLDDQECVVRGRPWGIVVEPKCCQSMHARGLSHWHVLSEREGESAVWDVRQEPGAAPYNLRPGGPCEPDSRVDSDFADACALQSHQGITNFFQGQMFGLIRDDQIKTTIEDTTVHLTCSPAVPKLRTARKEYGQDRPAGEPLVLLHGRGSSLCRQGC
ncbi:hypothetical protein [Streptomyces albipurpureus]|uniref:Uncharacterized protein n=1 Tax=Streptomyces albipurpureus TaxID=2897419 RepID=A0ABT0UKK2_9ACTN|nr:hypothetical protein [Streptomyces sp. CWNU-1]MCM2388135.1 hypothetical protein [Streptomyces sp. CWNU-1]